MTSVLERAKERAGGLGTGTYGAVLTFVVLALAGAVGLASKQPWLFPSLGPTVMLACQAPDHPSSQPRTAAVGHIVGIAVGAGFLALFRLTDLPPAPVGGLTTGYVLAGALSVAVTTLILALLHCEHPPAGASTLIVSLGILTSARDLAVMVGAVLLVVAAGWGFNFLLGVRPKEGVVATDGADRGRSAPS
jgi:CBS-domain-containing membrane protein